MSGWREIGSYLIPKHVPEIPAISHHQFTGERQLNESIFILNSPVRGWLFGFYYWLTQASVTSTRMHTIALWIGHLLVALQVGPSSGGHCAMSTIERGMEGMGGEVQHLLILAVIAELVWNSSSAHHQSASWLSHRRGRLPGSKPRFFLGVHLLSKLLVKKNYSTQRLK